MNEFMQELMQARSRCGDLAEALAAKHTISPQELPLSALPMCFNHLTIAVEHTSHYDKAWGAIPSAGLSESKIKQTRQQNTERLVMLSKTAFVWVMSSIEFTMKAAMAHRPTLLPTSKTGQLYFADVVRLSADNGLIDDASRRLWFGTNTIRNRMVHNNGIGDQDNRWDYPNGVSVVMQKDKMIEGTIMTFPKLTTWLIEQYAVWCDRFLSKAPPP